MPASNTRTTWLLLAWILIVASRAGHTTLFTGYLTALMVVGSIVALAHARTQPWLAACGVAIASCKPTYAIPLFLLMIARGDQKAALRGLGTVHRGRLLVLGTSASSNYAPTVVAGCATSQSAHMADTYEFPVNTWTRIDA